MNIFDPAIFDPVIYDTGQVAVVSLAEPYPKIGRGACDPLNLFVDIGHTHFRDPSP